MRRENRRGSRWRIHTRRSPLCVGLAPPPTPVTLLPLPTHLPRCVQAGLLSLQAEAFFLNSPPSFPPCLSWLLRGVPPS